MTFSVTETDAPCGAIVEGLDLKKQLDSSEVAALRQEWLRNHLLVFPNQDLSDDDHESYS
jgi:taurine dioxygenase